MTVNSGGGAATNGQSPPSGDALSIAHTTGKPLLDDGASTTCGDSSFPSRSSQSTVTAPGQPAELGTEALAVIQARERLCRRNVRAMFAFQLLTALAWGMGMGPVFDKYLFLLGSGWSRGPTLLPIKARNSLVGMAESISGITSLILAVPAGLLIDRDPGKRARILRASSYIGFIASIVAVAAILSDELILVYLMLFLFGAFSVFSNSASEAIFADSIAQGQRSSLFTTKAIITTVGTACGPLISSGGLLFVGDEWEPREVKFVLVVGALIFPAAAMTLFFFVDPPELEEACAGPAGDDQEGTSAATSQGAGSSRRFGPFTLRHVPVLLAVSDFTMCVGAGMTVKFFNLFFIQDHAFSPVSISLLQAAYPLVIAVFMKFTERLAKPLGRAQASLLFFSSNVACLLLMTQVSSLPILLAVFLLRGGFANSTYPIDRSILMDFTPTSQRGRWNAVESLTSMTWSGSAFIGGLLSDARDYSFTFLITALVYAVGCCVYAPLLGLVPRREADASAAASG
mmetsp:Transcript_6286/g.15625  ORF Transcript_6286/g.15625 Transcript_6286/m.15625 type:complete len:515 (+) Transcript_6286:135-1679(+)|eukprot:CAMPEP_0117526102 /NCGR_PEP_ID=MMETSP0784-20121206/36114_1 /TAXON_ID=39447 /ORGANISM="" /LENGTH=514 /DNA_ID=CAMNT_0005322323 /DNA_START=158 /DNA_END=1702 /DNA_ORIENTATION=+